jgi:hypothetical protein
MYLPHAEAVTTSREKITDYLLNPLHPDAAGKAAFFAALGFTIENWQRLADALRQVAVNCPVASKVVTPHGTKYVLDGAMTTPVGSKPWVRTVWIVDRGENVPRLVTAYPREEGDENADRT